MTLPVAGDYCCRIQAVNAICNGAIWSSLVAGR
jgi:hypothetical protein